MSLLIVALKASIQFTLMKKSGDDSNKFVLFSTTPTVYIMVVYW